MSWMVVRAWGTSAKSKRRWQCMCRSLRQNTKPCANEVGKIRLAHSYSGAGATIRALNLRRVEAYSSVFNYARAHVVQLRLLTTSSFEVERASNFNKKALIINHAVFRLLIPGFSNLFCRPKIISIFDLSLFELARAAAYLLSYVRSRGLLIISTDSSQHCRLQHCIGTEKTPKESQRSDRQFSGASPRLISLKSYIIMTLRKSSTRKLQPDSIMLRSGFIGGGANAATDEFLKSFQATATSKQLDVSYLTTSYHANKTTTAPLDDTSQPQQQVVQEKDKNR
eukprot:scaffold37836_cov79-Skeletonema_marinoi.AAC.2